MKKISYILILLIVFLLSSCGLQNKTVEPQTEDIYLENSEKVTVSSNDSYYTFKPDEYTTAIIFIPKEDIDVDSYSPLLNELAEKGYITFLIKDKNSIDDIRDAHDEIEHWYIGGHSNGGLDAAKYLTKTTYKYEGLILLASYSYYDLFEYDIKVLSVYGENDKILNKKAYQNNFESLGNYVKEYIIEGGNHSYFHTAGLEERDGSASISKNKQRKITISYIEELIEWKIKEHTHSFDYQSDDRYHWGVCDCGETLEKELHTGGTATEIQKAICEICGASYGNLKTPEHTHSYSSDNDKTHHWNICACGDISAKEKHIYSEATILKQPTETSEGIAEYTCIVCNYSFTEKIDKLEHMHSYTIASNPTHHWYECSCGKTTEHNEHIGGEATETKLAVCTLCGASYGELEPHQHIYSNEYITNESAHWKECACGDKDEIFDHEWQQTGIKVEQTETVEGIIIETCTVCLLTKETNIGYADHKHIYSDTWSSDEIAHWIDATCGHNLTKDYGLHTGGIATETERAICEVCNNPYGDLKPSSLGKLYFKPNANWKKDDARFAAYFFGTGYTWVDMTDIDSDGIYELDIPAGDWEMVIFCRMNPKTTENKWDNKWNQTKDLFYTIGYQYTQTEGSWDGGNGLWSELGHIHSYSEKEITKQTCTKNGEILYTCSCGDSYTLTFNAWGHNFSDDWYINDTHHWRECLNCGEVNKLNPHGGGHATSTKKAICHDCGTEYGELAEPSFTTYTFKESSIGGAIVEDNIVTLTSSKGMIETEVNNVDLTGDVYISIKLSSPIKNFDLFANYYNETTTRLAYKVANMDTVVTEYTLTDEYLIVTCKIDEKLRELEITELTKVLIWLRGSTGDVVTIIDFAITTDGNHNFDGENTNNPTPDKTNYNFIADYAMTGENNVFTLTSSKGSIYSPLSNVDLSSVYVSIKIKSDNVRNFDIYAYNSSTSTYETVAYKVSELPWNVTEYTLDGNHLTVTADITSFVSSYTSLDYIKFTFRGAAGDVVEIIGFAITTEGYHDFENKDEPDNPTVEPDTPSNDFTLSSSNMTNKGNKYTNINAYGTLNVSINANVSSPTYISLKYTSSQIQSFEIYVTATNFNGETTDVIVAANVPNSWNVTNLEQYATCDIVTISTYAYLNDYNTISGLKLSIYGEGANITIYDIAITKDGNHNFSTTTDDEIDLPITPDSIFFTESNETFNNPDRGFYNAIELEADLNGVEQLPSKFLYRNNLIHLRINLSAFSSKTNGVKDYELTTAMVESLNQLFDSIDKAGACAIVRFAYTYEDQANMEPQISMMLKHIEQFSQVLNKYKHVITALECGLVGPWGEMHSSDIANQTTYNQLFDKYLSVLDEEIKFVVRRPKFIYEYYGLTINTLDKFDYENNRIGCYNDGYLGSGSDLGTFVDREKEIEFLEKLETFPYGGEVTVPDSSYNQLSWACDEMFRTNLSYLNIAWNDKVVERWQNTTYTLEDPLYQGLTEFDYINNHLGYRFVCVQLNYEITDTLNFSLKIKNVGFGELYKTKTLFVILKNGNQEYVYEFEYNNELLISKQIDINNISSGNYELYLVLADSYNGEAIRGIRFANENMYNEEMNANKLTTITIK